MQVCPGWQVLSCVYNSELILLPEQWLQQCINFFLCIGQGCGTIYAFPYMLTPIHVTVSDGITNNFENSFPGCTF
jgi:hypothetical protein